MPIAFDHIANEPQTHIFIIAAGGYPYLAGGGQAQPTRDPELAGLTQLTSPAATAVALCEKFMEFHERDMWTTPLGSIRTLISSPGGIALPGGMSSGEPTMANIRQHYAAWFADCDRHHGNVAIFYFCGHGLEKTDHYLLASDFNDIPQHPWHNAFSFDDTRLAFYACKCETQLFFADACRMHTGNMLNLRLNISGLDMVNEEYNECPCDMTVRSAARNQAAYGFPHQPSNFAKALINGMMGQSAKRNHLHEWMIETNALGIAIRDIMEADPATAQTQVRIPLMLGESRPILRVRGVPRIPGTVTCDPDAALAHASFNCINMDGLVDHRPLPENAPWRLALQPGSYRVSATFADNRYQPGQIDALVVPPLGKETIRCR